MRIYFEFSFFSAASFSPDPEDLKNPPVHTCTDTDDNRTGKTVFSRFTHPTIEIKTRVLNLILGKIAYFLYIFLGGKTTPIESICEALGSQIESRKISVLYRIRIYLVKFVNEKEKRVSETMMGNDYLISTLQSEIWYMWTIATVLQSVEEKREIINISKKETKKKIVFQIISINPWATKSVCKQITYREENLFQKSFVKTAP